jgi:hypothetical protein
VTGGVVAVNQDLELARLVSGQAHLQEEIQNLRRVRRREEVNLEYLKVGHRHSRDSQAGVVGGGARGDLPGTRGSLGVASRRAGGAAA